MVVIGAFSDASRPILASAGLVEGAESPNQIGPQETRRGRRRAKPSITGMASRLTQPGAMSFRNVLKVGGFSTIAVLALINLLDYADSAAVVTLGPDIQRTLHVSDTAFNGVAGVVDGIFVLVALPLGLLADRRRRTRILASCAAVASLATIGSGVAGNFGAFAGARLLDGAGQASILPVHSSVLADAYPIAGRSRVLGLHSLGSPLAYLIAPTALAATAASVGGGAGWRWAFAILGLISLAVSVTAYFLREPVRGRAEAELVWGEERAASPPRPTLSPSLGASARRLLAIPTLRSIFAAVGVLGFVLIATPVLFSQYLDRTYHLSVFHRGLALSAIEIGSFAGVIAGGILGDSLMRRDPARVPILIAGSLAIFAVLYPAGLALPNLTSTLVVVAIAKALAGLATVPIYAFVASTSPPRIRSTAFAFLGLSIFLFGGVTGGFIAGAISDAHGPRLAITVLVIPTALIAAAIAGSAARHVNADLASAEAELIESRAEEERSHGAGEAPMLTVRALHVSRASRPVLFGIDLEVRRGEVLALLGTNGAGKSTLLRAISGLDFADTGTIHIDGQEVTYVAPHSRVELGLVQVPGGAALFDSMTVLDNLLVGAHTFAWDRSQVRSRIAKVTEMLPRLGERLGQNAGSLSGGEQQMLAIGKALMLEPKILLIDELSLGLAPVVVGELLDVIDRLKTAGVTLVIVEQSVNVALSIADRAIFLEKGLIRFSGSTLELLGRDDLLRAVFLGTPDSQRPPSKQISATR